MITKKIQVNIVLIEENILRVSRTDKSKSKTKKKSSRPLKSSPLKGIFKKSSILQNKRHLFIKAQHLLNLLPKQRFNKEKVKLKKAIQTSDLYSLLEICLNLANTKNKYGKSIQDKSSYILKKGLIRCPKIFKLYGKNYLKNQNLEKSPKFKIMKKKKEILKMDELIFKEIKPLFHIDDLSSKELKIKNDEFDKITMFELSDDKQTTKITKSALIKPKIYRTTKLTTSNLIKKSLWSNNEAVNNRNKHLLKDSLKQDRYTRLYDHDHVNLLDEEDCLLKLFNKKDKEFLLKSYKKQFHKSPYNQVKNVRNLPSFRSYVEGIIKDTLHKGFWKVALKDYNHKIKTFDVPTFTP